MRNNLLFIALLGFLFTAVLNADLLYMVQDRSLFMSGTLFLADCMRVPGGFLTWLGLWFTQFFYYPYLGASMLVLLWLALYSVLHRTFRPAASWSWLLLIPVVALIVSTVDLGYWIYVLKQHGYWFRETLGTLFLALLLWSQRVHVLVGPVLALITYPLLGWYSVLALFCMAVRHLCNAIRTHKEWPLAIGTFIVPLIVPPFIAGQYSAFRREEALYAGFPVMESNQDFSWALTLPFLLVALSLLVFCILPWDRLVTKPSKRPWLIPATAMLVLSLITFERNVGNRLYHAEMRMYRQVEDFRWSQVLNEINEAGQAGGSTRQMALCKDLALINTQHINLMFELSNGDANRVMRDSCGAYMLYTAGPLLALHHGMTNTAIRWIIESSVEYGLSVTTLKVLTLAALINGESKVAEKYLAMLDRNLFQSGWVRHYRPLAADASKIDDYPELTLIRVLRDYPNSEIYADRGHVEAEVYRSFSNFVNFEIPSIQELAVYYALKEKNVERFWVQLKYFIQNHPDRPVPTVFQEAACLFARNDAKLAGGLASCVSSEVRAHFDEFNAYANQHARPDMPQEEIGAILKPKFGTTYWWFYYFNHTILY